MIGLKRGTVKLYPHQEIWDKTAHDTIHLLKSILGDTAIDIQHIGSTSISNICSKPIIDIVIGLKNTDDIKPFIPILESKGVIMRSTNHENQMLFVIGDFEKDSRSHHIHVVKYDSIEWNNYINFRNYLNKFQEEAKKYEKLKSELSEKYPNDRNSYTEGKNKLINEILEKAKIWSENENSK